MRFWKRKKSAPPDERNGARDSLGSASVPTARVECPECGEKIPVAIDVRLGAGSDASQVIFTEANLSDLWAHVWTHTEQGVGNV